MAVRKCATAITVFVAIGLLTGSYSYASAPKGRGVVVEQIELNGAAAKAGLSRGDILRAWSSDGQTDEITLPFDIELLEMNQSLRSTVTITGFHGSRPRTWVLESAPWRISTCPEFSGTLSAIYRQGLDLAKAAKIQAAAKVWAKAAASQKGLYPTFAAWLLFRSAALFSESKRWTDADRGFLEALALAGKTSPSFAYFALRSWALSYWQRGDWAHAEQTYLQAITEQPQGNSPDLTIAATLDDLAVMCLQHRDLPKAQTYYNQALDIRLRLAPASLPVARTLNGLATVTRYPRGGDLSKAEEYLGRALAIAEQIAPHGLDVASILNNLGTIEWQRGNLLKSENYIHQALEIGSSLAPRGLTVADSLNQLGNITDLQGDSVKGDWYIQRALVIRQRLVPGSRDVAESENDIASIAEEIGELARAQEHERRALDIDKKLNPEGLDVAGDLNNLGYIERDRGNLAQAEQYQRQALAIEEKAAPHSLYLAETCHSLGDLARERAAYDLAREYYARALEIRRNLAPGSADHAASLAALASLARKNGQLDVADDLYQQTLNALESQTARLSGSQDLRTDFRAKHAGYYRDYIELLLEQKRPDVALQILERSKARMLLEMMTAAHVDIRNGVDPQLLEQERNLQTSLTARMGDRIRLLTSQHSDTQLLALRMEIEELLASYKAVQQQIQTRSPHYASLALPEPLSTRTIQDTLLDKDTLLIEYSLGAERSHVWVVSSHSLDEYDLPERNEIEAAARTVYTLMTEPNRVVRGEAESQRAVRLARAERQYRQTVSVLSQMILGPIVGKLGRKRLIVVSDGALQYIPFSILPIPLAGTAGIDPGNIDMVPLIMEHEVVSSPSVSVLARIKQEEVGRKRPAKAIAVIADPVFDNKDPRIGKPRKSSQQQRDLPVQLAESWAPRNSSPRHRLLRSVADVGLEGFSLGVGEELRLPRLWFSRLEAEKILATAPPSQEMKAVDFKASLSTATSPALAQYRIVHFATHGLMDSRNPELSGLVLSMVDAQGRTQNGFLDLQDIYNLNLPVDLVVLSACETGLGKEVDGEGLVGLTRGFMYAGASRVIASLWRVSDVATAELMERFYKAMEHEGLVPAAALREAQIQMSKEKRWSGPYYWAGFQLQGEWN